MILMSLLRFTSTFFRRRHESSRWLWRHPTPQSPNALAEISVSFDPMTLGSYMQSTALDILENSSCQRLSVKSFDLYHISLNKTVVLFFFFLILLLRLEIKANVLQNMRSQNLFGKKAN